MGPSFPYKVILITGGSSGIGCGLAEALHADGRKVIITGRREALLKEMCRDHQGMEYVEADQSSADSTSRLAAEVAQRWPQLDCVIANAGILRPLDFASASQGVDLQVADAEIDTNLRGVVRLAGLLLPLLLQSERPAAFIPVSSTLGLVPTKPTCPVYCATKAAVHSFCQSLRHQLRGTQCRVIEIIPPLVETNLQVLKLPPNAKVQPMALDDFIKGTVEGLIAGQDEVPMGIGVKTLHDINAVQGKYLANLNKT